MDALASTGWLAREIGPAGASLPTLRVVDTRFYLDPSRRGRDAWRAGHIPGAIFLDMDEDLSAPGGGRGLPAGRHPWPGEDKVAAVMGAAGIGPGVRVVAYDDNSGGSAARLWYLLRAHGHDDVAVLDGGIAKWTAEGRPLSTEEPRVEAVRFAGRLRPGFVVTKDDMVRGQPGRLVLDARAGERYRGEAEPIDPVAGRIPGAVNWPYGTEVPPGLTHAEEIVVYCGSGVTACVDLLELARAGRPDAKLYPGSWSDWCERGLPVERG